MAAESGQLLEARHQQKPQGRDCRGQVAAQATASLDQHTKLGLLDTLELAWSQSLWTVHVQ
jgi:hypothetical protein